MSHSGLAFVLILRPFFPVLVMSTDLWIFEHPSVLLFCSLVEGGFFIPMCDMLDRWNGRVTKVKQFKVFESFFKNFQQELDWQTFNCFNLSLSTGIRGSAYRCTEVADSGTQQVSDTVIHNKTSSQLCWRDIENNKQSIRCIGGCKRYLYGSRKGSSSTGAL